MKNNVKKYRCTFPKWVTFYKNGKPWVSRSVLVADNDKGMVSSDTYLDTLKLGHDLEFNTVEELLRPWKYWKEWNDSYENLSFEKLGKRGKENFFYKARKTKHQIIVTWGWRDLSEKFLKELEEDELNMMVEMRISDVKVLLKEFDEIPTK